MLWLWVSWEQMDGVGTSHSHAWNSSFPAKGLKPDSDSPKPPHLPSKCSPGRGSGSGELSGSKEGKISEIQPEMELNLCLGGARRDTAPHKFHKSPTGDPPWGWNLRGLPGWEISGGLWGAPPE